jgi:hypothetical protein
MDSSEKYKNICMRHTERLWASESGFDLRLSNGDFSSALVKVICKQNFPFMLWISW